MQTRKVNIDLIITFPEPDWCPQEDVDGVVGEALDSIINRGLEEEEVIVDFLSISVEEI